ncbi:MAG: hydantoinase/carbamoylase family amidase [Lachnospiraceae bacterium]|nr:hydantoinase/carbamoylase family amidase [Lachnospiraceae bacterium]
MEHQIADIQYCEHLFNQFYDIGSTESGGVTRLGYTKTEDRMHDMFVKLGSSLNLRSYQDQVGNTYLANSADDGYYLIGSHLDSVIEGGRYDGVAGIIAGLMVMKWAAEDGLKLPIRIGAFRCEESSNFGCCTVGSGLITKEAYKQDIGGLVSKEGETLEEVFKKNGYSLHPAKITGIKQYLELHIEQGKVLEECQTSVGIVTTIAGPRRFNIYLRGMAEHSGATPMSMRYDALCAAAEIILEIERIGKKEAAYQSVATVGVVTNHPNVLNVIPGEVELGVDIRGIEVSSLNRMERDMKEAAKQICKNRGIEYLDEKIGDIPPIGMSDSVELGLERAAKRLGISSRRMISGAGHDAMSFANICETGMVFIPCLKGISHNRAEFTSILSICDGARVIYEYLKGEAV